jgi:hypothetical protein
MNITSLLTYRDGGGKRHLRDYVKITLGILVLVGVASAVGLYNRHRMVSEVMAAPRPLDVSPIPTSTEPITEPVLPVEKCPSNPADWTFTNHVTVPGSNLKLIHTPCVYEKLEKTVAWVYATTALGYTRSAAADALGLSKDGLISYPPTGQITVLTDYKDEPQQVEVVMALDNWNLAEWRVNANEETGVEFTLGGCFDTITISGGEVTAWGDGYPVVCKFYADYRYQYIVSKINGRLLTIEGTKNIRRPLWIGYSGNGNWTWLGSAKVWDVELSQLSLQDSTINTTFMAEKYSLNALPLPQNWQSAVGQEYTDAFVAELNSNQ